VAVKPYDGVKTEGGGAAAVATSIGEKTLPFGGGGALCTG
jgi:hypothetical protein